MNYTMRKYIFEIPAVMEATLSHNEKNIETLVEKVETKQINKVVISGLGSSFTAAKIAHPLFRIHCQYPNLLEDSEEIPYYKDRWIDKNTLVISVSRSGERGAVVDAMNIANQNHALSMAITGVKDSLLAQTASFSLVTQEGPETAFPKTKSVATCSALLMRIALALSKPTDKKAHDKLIKLQSISKKIENSLPGIEEKILDILPAIKNLGLINVTGTCSNHGVALEAAIKIQEAALIPTRGDTTAGLWVGPVGGLTEDWLVVVLAMEDDFYLSKNLLLLTRNFKATSIAIGPETLDFSGLADFYVPVPSINDPTLAGLVYLPAIQLLTYHLALQRGLNPDKPAAMDSILKSILPEGREEPK